MPATSQAQARLFRAVRGAQEGEKESPEIQKIASHVSPKDAHDFAATDTTGLPNRIKKESMYGNIVGQYNEYGRYFQTERTMQEIAEDLMQMAEFAENTVMSEASDWYDGATIKRNMKEVKSYVAEFAKIAKEQDSLKQRAHSLYEDVGRVLDRYFEIYNSSDVYDSVPNHKEEYPLDDNGDEVSADNQGINRSSKTHQRLEGALSEPDSDSVPATGPGIGEDEERRKYQKGLCERVVRLARHRLRGEALVKFDLLPEKTQIKCAWRCLK